MLEKEQSDPGGQDPVLPLSAYRGTSLLKKRPPPLGPI